MAVQHNLAKQVIIVEKTFTVDWSRKQVQTTGNIVSVPPELGRIACN